MAAPIRLRLARAILGARAKEFIPPLTTFDGWGMDATGRLKSFKTKPEQLQANIGWVFAANTAIADPCAAVELKLYRKKKDGDREEVTDGPALELMDLMDAPNLAHTGEQLRQLHFTYMNLVGESYVLMLKNGEPYVPAKGILPDALQILPSHQCQFILGDTYTKSSIKFGQVKYPITAFIRDINPDPNNPYLGRSVIAAAAATIDTDEQMKEWNRRFFANNARPSLVFSSKEGLDDESYERWRKQFLDEHTGTENAYKPLLIEGGDVKNVMMSQSDLDFLESRKFSKDEILAMFRVSPGILGMTENVNRANMDAAFYLHAVINVLPRVRQFVKQLNATLVQVYDPSLELDFENPVPEDVDAKLKAAKEGVNKWWTIDEVRDMYGEDPLPNKLGGQLYVPTATVSLDTIADPNAPPADEDDDVDNPQDSDDDNDDDLTTGDTKALAGVKKKT